MKKVALQFGLLAFLLLILFQLSKYSLLLGGFQNELFIAFFAGLFLLFGFFVSRLIFKQKETVIIEKIVEAPLELNEEKIKKLGISLREYEVLQEIAKGLSNQEIANKLFISETTVKSHVSNLLIKLEAKRRTQAVSKAKGIGIL
ncbi:MAG: response regulator transcription factor [Saprospiraceae bacterium]|nr:response regulator transcription factor [Saprospiraceae bacterium]